MKHLGDITLIKGNEAPVVDCVIGGSPCQDLSLAGKRAGLAGARSGLYMEQIRIIKEMREADVQRGKSDVDVRPRYMVWENVPGAFSTNGGKDFAAVLEEAIRVAEPEAPNVDVPEKGWPTSGCFFDEMGKWSVAWRILDAQFWGVPQRRRRIALVADFGGLSASEILFVRKGVSGNLEPSKPKRKEASRDAGEGSDGAVGCDLYNGSLSGDKAVSLNTNANATGAGPTVISVDQGGGKSGANSYENISPTLTCTHGGEPAVVYGISPYHSNCMKSDNPTSGYYVAETSRTLDALNCGYPGCNQGGMAVVQPVYGIDQQGGKGGANYSVDVMPPMMSDSHGTPHAVAYTYDARGNGDGQTVSTLTGDHQNRITDYTSVVMEPVVYNGANITSPINVTNPQPGDPSHTLSTDTRNYVVEPVGYEMQAFGQYKDSGIASALKARDYKDATDLVVAGVDCRNATEYPEMNGTMQAKANGGFSLNCNQVVRVKHIVRRLTPLECERLQGYPDGWTDIGEWVDSKGKKHKEADSPRYKALGNSIALPPWKWALKRLCACYERDATMASLFDGIGGFPYIWEQLNGKGSCLWASEIEEFPMAVTKVRFGE